MHKTYWIDAKNGDNKNSGLTRKKARKTIASLLPLGLHYTDKIKFVGVPPMKEIVDYRMDLQVELYPMRGSLIWGGHADDDD